METMIAIAVGVGFTGWLVWRNPKITIKLPAGVQILVEPSKLPPQSSPPLLKGDGCDPGEDCNRQNDSH